MKHQINTIIFDLGGVILNIDYHLTENAFEAIGFPNFAELYTQFKQTDLFVKLEKGVISPQDFLNQLQQYAEYEVSHQAMIEAWNAMLLDLPVENLELLEQLKDHYRLVLLSNTNAIHYECFFDQVEQLTGRRDLSPYFEKEYYSHHIGKRKPDQEVFDFILGDCHIEPENTLYIDDSPQHLETAKSLHLKTLLKDQSKALKQTLKESDLLPF